jgi:hypothetical protein
MSYNFDIKCLNGEEERIIVTDEFINKNNFSLIPPDEIVEILDNDNEEDFLGFKRQVYLDFLPWDLAKKYFKIEYIQAVEKGEEEYSHVGSVPEATQDFLDYMVFAWMKAMDERGISASRSIQKLSAYMIVLGREDVSKILEDDSSYNPYGRPALKEACEILGISYPDYL